MSSSKKLAAVLRNIRFPRAAGIFIILCLPWSAAACHSALQHFAEPAEANNRPGNSIAIAAVGDIMLGTENLLPADDGRGSFAEVIPHLKGRDIVFGNLEGPLTDQGQPAKTVQEGRSYVFRMPPRYVKYLKEAGFNMLSIANNHTGDYGLAGRNQTLRLLDENGIAYSGLPGQVAEKTVQGVRVAMLAFGTNKGCQDLRELESAAAKVAAEAGKPNTLVIVSFHGGAEGGAYQHVPRGPEIFLGENRGDLRRFARAMIDAGAALVVGHGPHVPRGMEFYKGRLIAYSLGNFATARGINVRGLNGQAPLLLVELSPRGEFLKGQIVSFSQSDGNRPKADPGHQAARTINRLSQADFDHPPVMTPEGHFSQPDKQRAAGRVPPVMVL